MQFTSLYILELLALFVATHFVVRYIVYCLFGLWIGFFNPLTASLNSCKLEADNFSLQVRSIRLRFSPFSGTHKIITIKFLDVTLDRRLEAPESSTKESRHKNGRDHSKSSGDEAGRSPLPSFDPSSPVKIYSKNYKLRRLAQFFLSSFPNCAVTIDNFNMLLPHGIGFRVSNLVIVANVDAMNSWKIATPFKIFDKKNSWLSEFRIEEMVMYDLDTMNTISQFLSNGRIVASFFIDIARGQLSNLQFSLSTSLTKISVLQLIGVSRRFRKEVKLKQGRNKEERRKRDSKKTDHSAEIQPDDVQNTFFKYGLLFRLFANADISVDQLQIFDIPVASQEEIATNIDDPDRSDNEGLVLAQFYLRAFNLNIAKMLPNQVGYDLHFSSDDMPIQGLLSILSLNVTMDFSRCAGYKNPDKVAGVASISNFSVTAQTTAPANVLQLLLNGEDLENKEKQTVVSFRFTVTGLALDFTTQQLGILITKYKDITNHMVIVKPEDEQKQFHKQDSIGKMYIRYLLRSYPSIVFKVLVEKPVFMLKIDDQDHRFSHMVVLTPSLCGFELNMEKHKNEVELETRLDMPNLAIDYRRRNGRFSERVLVVKDSQVKCFVRRKKLAFAVSMFINLSFVKVNLVEIKCLNGISQIANSLIDNVTIDPVLSAAAARIRKMNAKPFDPQSLFRELPSWFNTARVDVGEITIRLGARSILMPHDVLVSEELPDELKNRFAADSNYLVYHLSRLSVSLSNDAPEISVTDDDTSTRAYGNILAPEDYFWIITSTLEGLRVRAHYYSEGKEGMQEAGRILTLPVLTVGLYAVKESSKFLVQGNCDRCYLDYTLAAHFLICSSVYFLRNTIGNLYRKGTTQQPKRTQTRSLAAFLNLFSFELKLQEIQARLMLATDFRLRLDVFKTSISLVDNPLIIKLKMARLCVMPNDKVWYRALGIQDVKILYDLLGFDDITIDASSEKIFVNIPYDFIVHRLFDGISSTVKLSKQMSRILKNNEVSTNILPRAQSKPVSFRHTEVRSKLLSILFDDDVFEADLAMIYQLGLIEQRNRLAKLKDLDRYISELKARMSSDSDMCSKIDHLVDHPWLMDSGHSHLPVLSRKIYKVAMNMSSSWIALVQEFKLRRMRIVDKNVDYLYGLGVDFSGCSKQFNANLEKHGYDPPLFSVFLDDLKLVLEPPILNNDQTLARWMQRVGCGIPEDTKYSTLIPLHASLRASRVRVHLRDYPLPVAYIPKAMGYSTKRTLVLEGNVCLYEELALTERQIRWVYTSFLPGFQRGVNDEYMALNVPRSMATTKALGELIGHVKTDRTSIITWGQSMSAGFRQLTIAFDKFSKPKTDPSPKLGVWDKLRNILHGFIRLYWDDPTGELKVNIKGSMDPYKIFAESAGFTLSFRDRVCWHINDPEREFPRDTLVVTARRVVWAIPNHLSEPLPCWCSPKLVFLPADRRNVIIPSMYGYYLNGSCLFDASVDFRENFSLVPFSKVNISLSGEVTVKLSFLFERRLPDGTRTSQFKPHYENVLCAPNFIADKEHYDAYDGFRSNYIHMALTLKTENSKLNSMHLTPKSIASFLQWFKLFGNNITTPVKNGRLWASRSKSVKFSRHLFSFKFLFLVNPLFFFHGYRIDLSEPDTKEIVGMKARISKFKLDLHERREPMIKENALLDRESHIMHMKFNVGELSFEEVDMRTVKAEFSTREGDESDSRSSSSEGMQFEIFDKNEDWIDEDDYTEVGLPGLNDCYLKGRVIPLLHSTLIRYLMHRHVKSDFGDEDSHEYQIDQSNLIDTHFNNVLEVQNVAVKWNCQVRDIVFQYLREVEFRDSYIFSSSFKAMNLVRQKLKADAAADTDGAGDDAQSAKFENVNRLSKKNFDADLRKVDSYLPDLIPLDYFLVRLNNIQLQMIVDETSDSMLLFSAPGIDLQIVQIKDSTQLDRVKTTAFETRMGTIFQSADLFAVYRKDIAKISRDRNCYGSTGNWPVFNDNGEYDNLLSRNKILSNVQIVFRFDKVSSTIENDAKRNKFFLDVPTFETTIDSDAYLTFSSLVQNLLIYSEPEMKRLNQIVRRMVLATDFNNLDKIYERTLGIADELSTLYTIRSSLDALEAIRDVSSEQSLKLRHTISSLVLEMFVYTRALMSGGADRQTIQKGDSCKFELLVTAGQFTVNLRMEGKEFVSLEIADSMFRRLEMINGSTENVLKVRSISALNRDENILFPELLTAYNLPKKNQSDTIDGTEDMISVNWGMGRAVGGIRVIKKMKVSCHPMKLEVEEKTGRKIRKFLFPDDKTPFSIEDEVDSASGSTDLSQSRSSIESSSTTDTGYSLSDANVADDGHQESAVSKQKFRVKYPTKAMNEALNVGSEDVGPDEMISRANNYFNINRFALNRLTICISIYARGKMRILNVNNFVFNLPTFRIGNRLMTFAQLTHAVEHHLMKTLLKHAGKLVRNKFIKRKRKRVTIRRRIGRVDEETVVQRREKVEEVEEGEEEEEEEEEEGEEADEIGVDDSPLSGSSETAVADNLANDKQ